MSKMGRYIVGLIEDGIIAAEEDYVYSDRKKHSGPAAEQNPPSTPCGDGDWGQLSGSSGLQQHEGGGEPTPEGGAVPEVKQ